jgi:hypothetical protein
VRVWAMRLTDPTQGRSRARATCTTAGAPPHCQQNRPKTAASASGNTGVAHGFHLYLSSLESAFTSRSIVRKYGSLFVATMVVLQCGAGLGESPPGLSGFARLGAVHTVAAPARSAVAVRRAPLVRREPSGGCLSWVRARAVAKLSAPVGRQVPVDRVAGHRRQQRSVRGNLAQQ